jgi:2-keto-4-pentenoate hydratase
VGIRELRALGPHPNDTGKTLVNTSSIEELAALLAAAEANRAPVPPIRETVVASGAKDPISAAYAIQDLNVKRRVAAGGRVVGRKIGLTSLAVQKQLGVDSPDFGTLFADMAFGDAEEIPLLRTLQAKVEAEVALILERDLSFEKHTFADLIAATAYAVPAIEVVGSRIANWDIRLIDTVADNASSSLFVLGSRPVRLENVDLYRCAMSMRRSEAEVSKGSGAACLGNPLNAAVWLADRMVRLGTPLKAGDILMTGALGPMVPVDPGDRFEARIEGLGEVRTAFSR